MDYLIRPAQSSDIEYLPTVEKIAAQRYRPYLHQLGLSMEKLQDIVSTDFLRQALGQQHLWVAAVPDAQERIVGFVILDRLPSGYFVVELDVLPNYGRRGIGSALIKQVLHTAQTNALQAVTLTTFRQVPWTIPFYQKLGFEIVMPTDYTPEIRAIVEHEAHYGFSRQVRVVMQCQIPPLHPIQ